MRTEVSGRPIICASARRLVNGTLQTPETVTRCFAVVPIGDEAARLHRHRAVALHLEMLAADVRRVFERRIGVAARGRDGAGDVAAGFFEQENIVLARGIAVDHRGKRLDIDGDRLQRVLGQRNAIGDHDGNRLADKAHLVGGDDRLHVTLGRRQRIVPQRNRRLPRRYRPR